MSDRPERKIVTTIAGSRRYCVLGPELGIDFHVDSFEPWVIAGLECHYRKQPSHLLGEAPFSEECWLHGGRCWGDGTSLYATEFLYPLFKEMGVEAFWSVLEAEYAKRLRDAFPAPEVAP